MRKTFLTFALFFCSLLHAEKNVDILKDHVCTVLPSIEGWCSKEKAVHFIDCILEVKPQVWVEIGVFGGRSVFPVASAFKFLGEGTLIAIDSWDKFECIKHLNQPGDEEHLDWWGTRVNFNQLYNSYLNMLKRYGLEKYCTTLKMSAEKAAAEIKSPIDVLYLDAIYDEAAALEIMQLYLPKVRSGGYIWINDALGNKTQPTLDLLIESCDLVTMIEGGSCILFKKR